MHITGVEKRKHIYLYIYFVQEINVNFEGSNASPQDFDGIKQLLQQLFLKAHINVTELADMIIGNF